jgi:hypothetical protein
MDINKMLAELPSEREQVEEAIQVLEQLARGRGPAPRQTARLDDTGQKNTGGLREARTNQEPLSVHSFDLDC